MTAKADGAEVSQRLSKIETAISRRKTIEFTYYTIERDSEEKRKVDPYHLVYRGGQFYLIGHSHERDADPGLPPLADPRQGLLRLEGRARLLAARGLRPPRLRPPRRVAARRDPGRREDLPAATASPGWSSATSAPTASSATRAAATARPGKGRIFETEYASSRQMVAWVAALAPERDRARPARARRRGGRAARAAHASATAPTSSRPKSVRTVPPRAARRRAPTGAPSPRSAPSASPAW